MLSSKITLMRIERTRHSCRMAGSRSDSHGLPRSARERQEPLPEAILLINNPRGKDSAFPDWGGNRCQFGRESMSIRAGIDVNSYFSRPPDRSSRPGDPVGPAGFTAAPSRPRAPAAVPNSAGRVGTGRPTRLGLLHQDRDSFNTSPVSHQSSSEGELLCHPSAWTVRGRSVAGPVGARWRLAAGLAGCPRRHPSGLIRG
jgi:hypothetical protein